MPVSIRPTENQGFGFTRQLIAQALGGGDDRSALAVASARWGEKSAPAMLLKAAVSPLVGANSGALVESEASAFFSLAYQASLLGRIPFRKVPFRTRIVTTTTGFSGAWVGEGAPKAVSAAAYAEAKLDPLKCVSLAVVSDELLHSDDADAEQAIRDDLVGAVSAKVDATFAGTGAGTVGVEPAGIAAGAPTTAYSATSDGATNLAALIATFTGDLENVVLIGSGRSLATLADASLPLAGVTGTALGIPVYATAAAGTNVLLVDPTRIAVAFEGIPEVKVSREALVQMDSAPTNPPTAASVMVSLWQENLIGFLAEVYANWRAAPGSVAVLTGVQ